MDQPYQEMSYPALERESSEGEARAAQLPSTGGLRCIAGGRTLRFVTSPHKVVHIHASQPARVRPSSRSLTKHGSLPMVLLFLSQLAA